MKISLNWLSDFIEITEKDHDKIQEVITANTAEVETMEKQGGHLENVIVGKVVKLGKHPNADRLSLAVVTDGQENYKLVCGGSNLREGMLVAYAKVGAVVRWHGSEVMKLEKAKIRGEESFGMICAAEEIGLDEMFPAKEEHEIVDLTAMNLQVGAPLSKALGLDDTILDVDNHAITNRADLFSQRGFAREFVANGLGKPKKPKTFTIPENNSPLPIQFEIKDKEVCSRITGVYLTGIEVKESPDWMKKRLSACGIRPISNIVDITNYVMLELGMPTHAFDLEQVKGRNWTMRKSKKGEKVITLDQKEFELIDDVIINEDGHEIFDLAGIMGGYTSGINQKTEKVWLHAPVYHPTLIRNAMRKLGQVTDAGIIYEKGIDNELAMDGLKRCVELILELCPGAKVASKVMDIRNSEPQIKWLPLHPKKISRLIGAEIPEKTVFRILDDLGFEYKKVKDGFTVSVPSWRMGDVLREADIIEEIARIYGYDNIPWTTPLCEIKPVPVNKRRELEKQIKTDCVSAGFDEIYTYAFLGPELLSKCGMEVSEETIEVANPISSDMSLMRQSLLPRMLETVADNLRYKNTFRLFELNKVYFRKSDTKHDEKSTLVMATAGEDFGVLKGAMEELGFTVLPVKNKRDNPLHHPGRVGEFVIRGRKLGYLYEVHPQILKNFDIKTRVTVAEADIEGLHELDLNRWPKYEALPKFPSVNLDVSIAVPRKSLSGDFLKTILATDKKLITDARLIDEYIGEKIAADKRALTYSITYRAGDRTLTDGEVETVHKQVISRLKNSGAEIR